MNQSSTRFVARGISTTGEQSQTLEVESSEFESHVTLLRRVGEVGGGSGGYFCGLPGAAGYFRSPGVDGEPQGRRRIIAVEGHACEIVIRRIRQQRDVLDLRTPEYSDQVRM